MTAEKRREIASKGGIVAHRKGTAHVWNPETAKIAGQKGGQKVSKDKRHMSEIGRIGGLVRGARRGQK